MHINPDPIRPRLRRAAKSVLPLLVAAAFNLAGLGAPMPAQAQDSISAIPEFAPIGVRVDHYLPIPATGNGPAVDPAKGYRLEQLGRNLYMVTDNIYQSMFLVYEQGVVVIDAPPVYAAKLRAAIGEVTDKPVTHVIYSHSHTDHIGGVRALGGHPRIIAHEETKRLLERAHDDKRPLPTRTFRDSYTLKVGSEVLKLSYHGNGHEPGNIFIEAPAQRTLMVVDIVFPGWMPFRRFAVAQDVPGYFQQVRDINAIDFDKLVTGHVTRIGNHDDVRLQIAFNEDVRAAAAEALRSSRFGDVADAADAGNAWALVNDYTARVAAKCVVALTPKWRNKLAAFDTFVWDQCYAMEQSLRID
jgi:glyoxylase-like metal-dependent hydrolase (beta-lactamase superfamily II)